MTTQSSYSERIAAPGPGVIQGSDFDTATGIAETASPGIPAGRAVGQGTLSDQGVTLGAADLTHFRGVSVRDVTLGAEQDNYLPPNNVAVLTKGSIWLEPAVAVAANDPVNFNATTGVFSNTGGVGPIKGARWKTSCGVGGRAVAEFAGNYRQA